MTRTEVREEAHTPHIAVADRDTRPQEGVVVVGIAAVGAAGEIVGLGTCCAEVVEVGGSRI